MALFDTTRTHVGGSSLWGRMSAKIGDLASSALSWNDARVTRKALGQLTNRELDDIGLCRGDIDDLVRRINR